MTKRFAAATVIALSTAGLRQMPTVDAARGVEVLRATGAVPAHIAGMFREPLNFQQAKTGEYFVFDRRAHAVFSVPKTMEAARKLLQIGAEPGAS